jgi:fumarate hydratase, class II
MRGDLLPPDRQNLTLKQAALDNGVSEDLFDKVVNPFALTRPGSADIPSTAARV